jgi:hypothetical protein
MQQETREMLGLCGAKSDGDVGVRLTTRQYLAADGSVVSSQRMPQLMTSWGLLYSWFKKSFPEQNYHLGHEFQNLEQSESSVTSYFQSGTHDSADLLIGADGLVVSRGWWKSKKASRSGELSRNSRPLVGGCRRMTLWRGIAGAEDREKARWKS